MLVNQFTRYTMHLAGQEDYLYNHFDINFKVLEHNTLVITLNHAHKLSKLLTFITIVLESP